MVVIKGLVALTLTYILAPLVTNHKIIEEINGIFYSLLWNNKGDKIKRSVMINTYESGGLKMIDISFFNKSLKTTWIKKYLDESNRGKWTRHSKNNISKRPIFTRNCTNLVRSKLRQPNENQATIS